MPVSRFLPLLMQITRISARGRLEHIEDFIALALSMVVSTAAIILINNTISAAVVLNLLTPLLEATAVALS